MDKVVESAIMKNYQKMYRLAFSYVKNEHDAMDIVQESAYRSMKEAIKLSQPEYVDSWLWKITRNTALDFLRRQQREQPVEVPPENVREDHYADLDLAQALDLLTEKERTIIIFKYFEDLKLSQIAELIDENLNTVKSILYRALKKLKVELEVEEIT